MKVKTRRWRNRNRLYLKKRGQNSNHGEESPEPKQNASGVEVNPAIQEGNCSTHEENAAASTHEENAAASNPEPKAENLANNEVEVVQAAPASDDEDSGTENDRNEIGIPTDDEYESEKECYKVEVRRTMRDIMHTRHMLFSLTTRVDQLLEFCKILQSRQNQQQQPDEHHQQQQEHNPPDAGAGKSSQ